MKKSQPPKNGEKCNGAIWFDGEPCVLILDPNVPMTSVEILKNHVAEQRAYIARLTARVERVEEFLATGA